MANDPNAIVRLVYASRANEHIEAGQLLADVRAVLATARARNAQWGITGLLIVANGHFLQVLEGPRAAVETLYKRILRDPRHRDVTLLSNAKVAVKSFADWSMGLVERTEPEAATEARLELLHQRLAVDPAVDAADFFRLILAPSVNTPSQAQPGLRSSREAIPSVAFAGLTGMWSAAVLQHVSGGAMLRTGRTTVTDPDDPAQRSLIEYVDLDSSEIGPLRVLSLTADPATLAPMAPLMERLSLIVFMLASSDVDGFVAHVLSWLALPQVMRSCPTVLVLGGLPMERVLPLLEAIRASTSLTVDFASVKLGDTAAVWKAAQWPLRGRVPVQRAAPQEPRAGWSAKSQFGVVAPVSVTAPARVSTPKLTPETKRVGPVAAVTPAPALPVEQPPESVEILPDMGRLRELLGIDGATHVAVFDADMATVLLSTAGTGVPSEALQSDAEFLRSERQLLQRLLPGDGIEDLVVATTTELKIFRPLPQRPAMFIAVTLARARAELAVARLKLQDLVLALDVQSL